MSVLARAGTPAMVGEYALGLAITGPVFMLTNLQMRGVQATDAQREYRFSDYLCVRLLTTAVALLVVGGIVAHTRHGATTVAVILAVGFAKALESVSDVYYGLFQQRERMDRIAVSLILRGVLSLALGAAVLFVSHSLLGAALAMAAAWAVVLFAYDVRQARGLAAESVPEPKHVRPDHAGRSRHLARLVWLAAPLGVVTCLISLTANVPRYFIDHYLGLGDVGIYSAIGYLTVAGNTVVGALAQSATPRLAVDRARGDRDAFFRLLVKLAGIGAVLGVGGVAIAVVAGPAVLKVLYGPEYAGYGDVLVLAMAAGGVGYVASFLGYGMTAARYFRVQAPLFLAVAASVVLASALLIPPYHLRGAAWAMLVGMAVQLAGVSAIILHIRRHFLPEAA